MRPSWIAIGTFLVVVLAATLFFAVRISESPAPAASAQADAPRITLVSASDAYHAGTHTVTGTLMLPTACTPFTATSSESADGNIRIDVAAQADDGVCLELPATTTFKASARGNASSTISIYLNGELATTTAP